MSQSQLHKRFSTSNGNNDKTLNDGEKEHHQKAFKPNKSLVSLVEKLVRFVGVWGWILVSLPILWIIMPLRALHPLLRKYGILHGSLPLDLAQVLWARSVVWLSGIHVEVQGVEHLLPFTKKSAIIMANHSSSLDPFLTMGYVPVAPKFIFKRSLILQMPPLFVLAWIYGHVPINRSNRESAIQSLESTQDAAKKVQEFHRSVAVFPEGTRSKNGTIQPFKRGPFYLAAHSKAPVLPVYIQNAYELYKPSGWAFHPDPGTVRVTILPPVPNNESVDVLQDKVREVLLQAETDSKEKKKKPVVNKASGVPSLLGCIAVIVFVAKLLSYFFL